jgi:ornithine cyclodeaminase/alanine dehydrogenase-like protein (mu-crystallin family)
MVIFLNESDVAAALDYATLIPAMENALTLFSTGKVVQPLRNWLTIEPHQRFFGLMPAATSTALGVKLVSFFPRNAGSNVATVTALVVLFDPDTGEALAILEGSLLTAMRTAAVSAAVTRRLASPKSRVLALLGSGVQAAAHLAALRLVREFDEIRVWSRTPAHAARFASRHGAVAMDAEAAVRGADVIVTVTPAQTPILQGRWLKEGALVNAVGAPMPSWRELDDDAMSRRIVVESRAAALEESGDLILSRAPIYAEVGEIFAGMREAAPGPTTIFKSVGIAIEDVTAARLVFDAARARAAPRPS